MNSQDLRYTPSALDLFERFELSGGLDSIKSYLHTNVCASTIVNVPVPKGFEKTLFTPKRIIKNNNAMIVFWNDGTKTIVKRASDELDSDYAAFTAALGIKYFGSNSALKRIVARTETQKPKKQKNNTRYRIACPVCGFIFIRNPSEVRTQDGTVSTKCPDCGKFITVDFK